jgi:hypothetical protein
MIDEYLLRKGLTRRELPKKVEEYEKGLKEHTSIYNEKPF